MKTSKYSSSLTVPPIPSRPSSRPISGGAGGVSVEEPTPPSAGLPPRRRPDREEIEKRAAELWRRYGSPSGRDEEIWLEAERGLLGGGGDKTEFDAAQNETERAEGADSGMARGGRRRF